MNGAAEPFWSYSRDGWLQIDWPNGRVLAANRVICSLLEVSETELIGRPFWELFCTATWERSKDWVAAWQTNPAPVERVGLWLHRDNRASVPIALRTLTLDSPAGQTHWVMTEDRREVQELIVRLSEIDTRLDETERIAKLGWWEWDIPRDELTASVTLPQLLGISLEAAPKTLAQFLETVHPADREFVRERHHAAIHRKEPYVADFRMILPDGTTRYLHSQGRVERDENDQPLRLFGTCQDVTDRMMSLIELRESEQKYREIVETSSEFIWAVDEQGRWTFVNSAAKEIYGYEPEEMIGKPFTLIDPPEVLPLDWQVFQNVLAGGKLTNYETVHLRKDGRRVTLNFNAVAKLDADGRVIGTTGTGTDITERKEQERQLIEREKWFRTNFENDPQCLMILSLDGTLLDANPAAVRLSESNSAQELVGQPAADCLVGLSQKAFSIAVQAAARGDVTPWQTEIVGKRGTIAWVEGHLVPLRDANNNVVRILAAAQDLTLRRKADLLRDGEQQVLEEIASGQSQSRALRTLIKMLEQQLPGAIFCICLHDPDEARLQIVGYSEMSEEVVRRLSSVRVVAGAPSFADAVVSGERRIVEDTTKDVSWDSLRSFADRFQLRSCWSEPIRGFSQDVFGVLSIFFMWPRSPNADDLKLIETGAYLAGIAVHRTRSEQKLRNSEMRFRTLFQHSPDAIYVESLSGVVLDANPAACELNGLSRRELLGKHVLELVPSRCRDDVRRTFPKLVREELHETEWYSSHPIRGEIPVSLHVSKIEYALQPALLLHVRDISERLKSESQTREIEAQLAHAGRLALMGELVAGISHEINQPLYAIANFANACVKTLQTSELARTDLLLEWTGKIAEQAHRAGEIIRRMRDFGRKSEQRRSAVDVRDMILEAIELVSYETRSQHISLHDQIEPEGVHVLVDRIQIQQTIVNLLRNAYQALEDNSFDNRFVTISSQVAGNWLRVSVHDNGCGFGKLNPESIFVPFFTTKLDGLGLGLTISRSIIEAHGGRLWAEPNSDRGVTVSFTLPIIADNSSDPALPISIDTSTTVYNSIADR